MLNLCWDSLGHQSITIKLCNVLIEQSSIYEYALTQVAAANLAAMEAEPSEQPAEQPAYFGLDESDIEEWLESSSNGSVHALTMAQAPSAVKLLTASVWRGPRTAVPSGDACRVVPPSRSPPAPSSMLC